MSTSERHLPYRPSEELWQLVAEHCDGLLTEPRRDRLEELLSQDAAARQFCIAYLDLHATILWRFREPEPVPDAISVSVPVTVSEAVVISPSGSETGPVGLGRFISRMQLAGAVAACAVFFTAYVVFITWGIRDERQAGGAEQAGGWRLEAGGRQVAEEAGGGRLQAGGEQVATITGGEDARWLVEDTAASNQKSEISNQKSKILSGKPLSLASGTVELKLKQGVRLLVEGPARWSVVDDNRVRLDAGKLVATVPHKAIGFTVKTPATEIIDLGTEFGVTVDERGQTCTQVFRGEVRLDSAAAAGTTPASAPRSITLRAGQAMRVDRGGQIAYIPPLAATPEQFIRPPAPTDGREFNPEPLSPYANYVIEETVPVAYWDFSRFQDSVRIVNDRIADRPFERFLPRHVGMLGPSAKDGLTGFGVENPAISQESGTAQPPGLLYRQAGLAKGDFSMAVWVQPEPPDGRQLLYYVLGSGHKTAKPRDGVRDSVMIIGALDPANAGKLAYFSGQDHNSTVSPTGKTRLTPGHWYSVVLVRQADKALVYLDGVLEIEAEAMPEEQHGDMFTFGQRADLMPALAYSGLLDEAVLWDRVLTATEVSDIYHRATSDTVPSKPQQP